MDGDGKMCFAVVGPQSNGGLQGSISKGATAGSMIHAHEVKAIMNEGEAEVSEEKIRVKRDGLVEELGRLVQVLDNPRTVNASCQKHVCPGVKIERGEVRSRRFLNLGFFTRRKLGLQLVSDGLGDFGLDGEYIGEIAIISLLPIMCITACIDQLRIHSYLAASALHIAFEHMRYAQLFPDLSYVSHDPPLLFLHAP